jgi:hypothetical protein
MWLLFAKISLLEFLLVFLAKCRLGLILIAASGLEILSIFTPPPSTYTGICSLPSSLLFF